MLLLEKDPLNVIITGVGGQGNVLASQILGQMLVQKGYVITIGETYGASQRGGSVMSHLRISHREQFSPLIPQGLCDLVVGLEPVEALRVLGPYGNPGVLMVVNTRPIHPIDVISGDAQYPELDQVLKEIHSLSRRLWTVPATDMALEMGDPLFSNIIMLGALSATETLPIEREGLEMILSELFPPERIPANLAAYDKGREAVREYRP